MMYVNKNFDGYLYFIYVNIVIYQKIKFDKVFRSIGVELSV